jgi:hypothetical protein
MVVSPFCQNQQQKEMAPSLFSIIAANLRTPLFVHPALWTAMRLKYLKVSVQHGCSPALVGPNHWASCPDCGFVGLYEACVAERLQRRFPPAVLDQFAVSLVQLAAESLVHATQPSTSRTAIYELVFFSSILNPQFIRFSS